MIVRTPVGCFWLLPEHFSVTILGPRQEEFLPWALDSRWPPGPEPTVPKSWTLWGPGIHWQRVSALPGPILACICLLGDQTPAVSKSQGSILQGWAELRSAAAGWIQGWGCRLEADTEAGGQHLLQCISELQGLWELRTQAWPSQSLWSCICQSMCLEYILCNSLLAWSESI